jgi:hypothetical protein
MSRTPNNLDIKRRNPLTTVFELSLEYFRQLGVLAYPARNRDLEELRDGERVFLAAQR